MEFLRAVLQIIIGVSTFCLLVMMGYQLIVGLFGFRKKGKDYADHDPASRFLILVPAHNEEKVIGDIVRNLRELDYPKDLYDYYVIADNCTDGTAEAARAAGARVIETRKESPDAPTGKPIALRKALEALEGYQKRYDLMMVFDADNLMDNSILREVNSQYLDKGKPDLIQCYLGVKNKKGTVAWSYYTGYTLTNRFFDLAKYRLGINCVIGGTGFAISTAYLYQRGGWNSMSLTEDFEIQVQATMEGRKILWNQNARVYDEKPTSLWVSLRQKTRWGQGHWYVALTNTRKLFRLALQGKIGAGEFISLLTYMYSMSAFLLAAVQIAAQVLLWAVTPGMKLLDPNVAGTVAGVAIFVYSYLFLFYVADRMDNGIHFSLKTIPVMIGGMLVNTIVGAYSQLVGLIRYRDQQHWVKTEHAIRADNQYVEKPQAVKAKAA